MVPVPQPSAIAIRADEKHVEHVTAPIVRAAAPYGY
jgi:hypothetical protein